MEQLYTEYKTFQQHTAKAHTKSILTDKCTLPKPIPLELDGKAIGGSKTIFPCKVHNVAGFEHIVSGVAMNVNLEVVSFKVKGCLTEAERLFGQTELLQAYDKAFSYNSTSSDITREPLFRFGVEGIIGCGAFGCTLLAVDNLANPPRKVAIKVVMNPEHSYMGIREAISLKWIQRKINGVVSSGTRSTMALLSTFYQQDRFCLVFELLDTFPIHAYSLKPPDPHCGNQVENWIPIGKATDKATRLHYLSKVAFQIIAGVSHLHSQGVIHSDLKPDNILRDPLHPSHIKVADFGNCIIFDQLKKYKGIFEVQTESHRAPELLAGLPFGRPADMWSIGVILCQAIIGKNPFHVAGSTTKTLEKMVEILGGLPESPYRRALHCSPELIAVSSDVPKRRVHPDGKPPATAFSTAVRTMRLAAILGLDKHEPVVSFISELLHLDPSRRLSCLRALTHPFLSDLIGLDLKSLLNNTAALDDSGIPIPKSRRSIPKPPHNTPPRTLSTLTAAPSTSLPEMKMLPRSESIRCLPTPSLPRESSSKPPSSRSSVYSVATTISRTSSLNHKLSKFSLARSTPAAVSSAAVKTPAVDHGDTLDKYTNYSVGRPPAPPAKPLPTFHSCSLLKAQTRDAGITSPLDGAKIPDLPALPSVAPESKELAATSRQDSLANSTQTSLTHLTTPQRKAAEKNYSRTSKILANLENVSDLSFGMLDLDDRSGHLSHSGPVISLPAKRKFSEVTTGESQGPNQPISPDGDVLDPSPKVPPVIRSKFWLSPSSSVRPSSSSSGEFAVGGGVDQTTSRYPRRSTTHPRPISPSALPSSDPTLGQPVIFGRPLPRLTVPPTLRHHRSTSTTSTLRRPPSLLPQPNSNLDYHCHDDILLLPSTPRRGRAEDHP